MKTILITGANRGIGLEFARQYAAGGQVVVANCRDKQKASALTTLAGQYPGRVVILEMNVADEQSIIQAAEELKKTTNKLDILINNAGTYVDEKGLSTVTMAGMTQVFSVNTFGPVVVTKHFLPFLKKGLHPIVASLYSGTSLIQKEGYRKGGQYSYASSKAALNMVIQFMAADLKEDAVCVIGISPGFVLTDMTKGSAVKPTLLSEESVMQMIDTLEVRTINDTGKIFEYNGKEVNLYCAT